MTIVGKIQTQVEFKYYASFAKCITKLDNEDLDLVMAMHNLLEYSSNYFDKKDSL